MVSTRMRNSSDSSSEKPRERADSVALGRRVLVVEDESRLRDMLQRAIRDMGFDITSAASAEAGMRLLDQTPADILLVDLNLPGMNGLEMLEIVHKRWPDMQAIVMTGFGDLQSAKRAMHMDAVDFLTKPCALGDLEVSLERARQRRVAKLPQMPVLPDPPPEEEVEDRLPKSEPVPTEYQPMSLEEMEKRHILATLEKNHGNRTLTAQELGISLRKLYYRLGQYQREGNIPPP
jgi:two-component system, response regulator RegA